MSNMKHRPWRVCFLPQLPQLKGKDEHAYMNFNQVPAFVESNLKEWRQWCTKHNSTGLVVLDEFSRMVRETESWFYQNAHLNERVIEGLLDNHTDTTLRVRIKKIPE